MDNFNQTFLNLMAGAEITFNPPTYQEIPPENYENITDALNCELIMKLMEKPLRNETEILRYSKIMQEDTQNSSNSSTFDPEDEYQKIISGYYINIDEALNIFKQCFNLEPNPFKNFHENALEYINFMQQEYFEQSLGNFDTIPTENFDDAPENPENISDSESDQLFIDTSSETSETSCFNVSLTGIEQYDLEIVEDVAMQQNNENVADKKPRRSKPKQKVVKNFFTPEQLPMSPKKTSTPNKSTKKNVQSISLSPISLTASQNPLPGVTPQEFQLLQHKDFKGDKEYLKYLENKFQENVYIEFGRFVYPVLTNREFQGLNYDYHQELINNEIMRREFFSRLTVFRKFPF